jgi:two-component system, chemotaxis family, sensor kinase CheA
MNDRATKSSIEYNLRFLSAVALGVFTALILALVLVQHSLVASQKTLANVVVPAQQNLGRLDSAVAGMFERQARISSSTGSRQLEALRDRSALQSELEGAGEHAREMAPAIRDFLASDDELYASIARYHGLHEDFAHKLTDAQSALRGLTEQAAAIAGVVQLKSVILLRRLASDPEGTMVREVVSGDARAQQQSVEDLANAALDLSALSGRIGLAPDVDALNSIAANEIAQNRQRIADRLEDLADLTAAESELSERVEALRKRFGDLTTAIGDEKRPDSLISIRRAIVLEQRHAAEVRDASAMRARKLSADVKVLQDAANAIAASSSKRAGLTANITGVGVFLLAALGVAASVLGARRVRTSVGDLRAQNRHLEQLRDELTNVNAGLEGQVAERTKALLTRERALQLVLDSTGDGLLSVGLDGRVQAERSRAASVWFGEPESPAKPIWALVGGDAHAELSAQVSYEQLVEGFLPFEVACAQMPKRVERQGRAIELAWKPVVEDGAMKRVLVVARDITEQLEAEKVEQEASELRDLVGSVLRDKGGFTDGVNDARALLSVLASGSDSETLRRALHTLKGNAAMFGFHGLAASCHAMESELAETGGDISADQVRRLREQLEASLRRMQDVFGDDFLGLIEVHERDLERLMGGLRDRYDHAALLGFVTTWKDEAIEPVLKRLATQANRIAKDLEKELDVQVDSAGVRLPPQRLRLFWAALVHAVRNAVDHGVEAPEERLAAGKPSRGRLLLKARTDAEVLTLQVEDDGRGIDFDALGEAAIRKGLPATTRQELVEAMFADGVTTKAEVTSLSGRGVGMAALRQACVDVGGEMDVASTPGHGTCLTFRFPMNRASETTAATSAAA